MEDKIFELMGKMYSDINKRFDGLQREIQHVGNQVTKLEYETSEKFTALFDGYKQLAEGQKEHDKRFDRIETKLDNLSLVLSNHDSKLEVLEGGRKK